MVGSYAPPVRRDQWRHRSITNPSSGTAAAVTETAGAVEATDGALRPVAAQRRTDGVDLCRCQGKQFIRFLLPGV